MTAWEEKIKMLIELTSSRGLFLFMKEEIKKACDEMGHKDVDDNKCKCFSCVNKRQVFEKRGIK